jgi:hypothetical protein
LLIIYLLTGASMGYARFHTVTAYAYVDVERSLPRMTNTDSGGRQVVPLWTFDNHDLFILDLRTQANSPHPKPLSLMERGLRVV